MSLQNIRFSQSNILRDINARRLLEDYNNYEYSKNSFFNKIENNFMILKVQKINNAHLYGLYLLHKEEMKLDNSIGDVREETLFHATSVSNALSIAHNNIDWRLTQRTRFGKGACFSPNPPYAHRYAGRRGAFVIARVLVKKIETTSINYFLEIPSTNDIDTTLGNNGNVYVKRFSQSKILRNIYTRELLEDFNEYESSNNSYFTEIGDHFNILKVQKINNPQVYGMYLLHKEEMNLDNNSGDVKEEILFHSTSVRNAISIAQDNIDWRLTGRTRFGKGACFSPSAPYAHKYAGRNGDDTRGVSYSSAIHDIMLFFRTLHFLTCQQSGTEFGHSFSSTPVDGIRYQPRTSFVIARVLVKNIELTDINYDLEIPSTNDYDTTLGNSGNVFVKYDDNTFYPEYIVHYS